MDAAFTDLITRLIASDGWLRGERPLRQARPDFTVAAIEARDTVRRAAIVTRLTAAGIPNHAHGDRLVYIEVPNRPSQERANQLSIEVDHLLGRHEQGRFANCPMCPAIMQQPREHPVTCLYSSPRAPHQTINADAICDTCKAAGVRRFGKGA